MINNLIVTNVNVTSIGNLTQVLLSICHAPYGVLYLVQHVYYKQSSQPLYIYSSIENELGI